MLGWQRVKRATCAVTSRAATHVLVAAAAASGALRVRSLFRDFLDDPRGDCLRAEVVFLQQNSHENLKIEKKKFFF